MALSLVKILREVLLEAQEVYKYQDTHAERIVSGQWWGNVWRYKIENAGDVLRELAKYDNEFLDPSYIYEKINKLEDFIKKQMDQSKVHPDDSYFQLTRHDGENLEKIKKAYEDQPTASEAQEQAKQLALNVIDGKLSEAQKQIDYFNKFRSGDTKKKLMAANEYK